MIGCPNYREEVVGRGLFSRGDYIRKCSTCGQSIDREYAIRVCKTYSDYKQCSAYKKYGIRNSR